MGVKCDVVTVILFTVIVVPVIESFGKLLESLLYAYNNYVLPLRYLSEYFFYNNLLVRSLLYSCTFVV